MVTKARITGQKFFLKAATFAAFSSATYLALVIGACNFHKVESHIIPKPKIEMTYTGWIVYSLECNAALREVDTSLSRLEHIKDGADKYATLSVIRLRNPAETPTYNNYLKEADTARNILRENVRKANAYCMDDNHGNPLVRFSEETD